MRVRGAPSTPSRLWRDRGRCPPRLTARMARSSSSAADRFKRYPLAPASRTGWIYARSSWTVSAMILTSGTLPAHLAREFHAADVRQRQVDDRDIGRAFADGLQTLSPPYWLRRRVRPRASPAAARGCRRARRDDRRPVRCESASCVVCPSLLRAVSWTKIVLPFPGADSTAIVPPSSATRSFMPDRPSPEVLAAAQRQSGRCFRRRNLRHRPREPARALPASARARC